MGKQIIKQPNGLYAQFCTIVDGFDFYNCTRDAIIEERIEAQKKKITEEVNEICDLLDSGGKPYYQFTIPFEKAKSLDIKNFGENNIDWKSTEVNDEK